MRFSKRTIFCFFILLIAFNNCRDEFSFTTLTLENHLVVDGGINDTSGPYFLKLGTTTSPDRPANPLTAAIITITDNHGLKEAYHEVGNGQYRLDGTIVKGTPGVGYVLEISLPNGKVYRSTTEIMPNVPPALDSPYWTIVNEKVISSEGIVINNIMLKVFLTSQLQVSSTSGYLRWGIDEVYSIFPYCPPNAISCPPICYVFKPTSSYNIVLVKTTDYATNSQLSNILLQSQGVDYTFSSEHILNVTQYSMNKSNFEYWTKAQELIMKRGSIFDTPPAKLTGNITNQSDANEIVFGYFEATMQRINRLKVSRGNIPFYLVSCYDYPERLYYSFCQSCEYLPGSTLPQPSWWF